MATMSRRSMLAAIGSTAAGAAVLAPAASNVPASAAEGGGGFGAGSQTSVAGQVAPAALTAGLAYLPIDPSMFHPITSGQGRSLNASTGTSILTPPGGLMTPVNLQVGSVIKQVTFAYLSSSGSLNLALWRKALTTGWSVIAPNPPAGMTLANASAVQTVTFTLNEPVDGSSTYMLLMNGISSTSQSVHGALIGYVAPPQAYIPLPSVRRALDTRTTGGKLNPGEERIVALGVPGFARAAVFNLTVTETEGGGYLAAFAANVPYPGNSSINWFASGQTLANGVISAVDGSGRIKLHCGGSRTQAIIDVQGYLL